MLTVYSTQGSPGASTSAMHLAANWAADGREVLLIELDPAGGSLSHNLGIQFTPGSASFVASGLPVQSIHLIDHAQDVLFENLHVMPAPASPTGARGIVNTFAGFAEDLRAISENEMAVVIDGGRVTADTAASALTTEAAGVVVVCANNRQLPSLEHLKGVLDTEGGGEGPAGCAVTVGKSPMDPDEWLETRGLTFCGSIEFVPDMATDLSAYMARGKRRSKKWRASLERVGEELYRYAHPPATGASRRQRSAVPAVPSNPEGADAAEGAGVEAPPEPSPGFAPPMAPAPATGHGDPHYLPPVPESHPGYGQSHYLPPTVGPEGYGQAPPPLPPEDYPDYGQPAPTPYPTPQYPAPPHQQPQYPDPPYEQPPYPTQYEQPQYPTPYEQPHAPPQHPTPYEQPHAPPQHPAPQYEQPYPTPQYPAPPYEQPHAPPQYPTPYEQPAPHPQHPTHSDRAPAPHEQSQPVPDGQPYPAAPQPAATQPESPPKPNIQPTGSFRDWALKLHGSNAHDMTAGRGG